jgi:type I restriction enzyme S subunit
MTRGRPFGDLLAMPLRSGVTVAASDRGAGIKMLNMGELFRYPQIPDVEMARVDLGKFDPERVLLRPGDLMFARRSLTLEGAGKCSIVKEINEPTTWESSIIRARLDNAVAHPPYYFYFFRSPLGRRLVETIVEQVAAAGIRLSELRTLTVPIPDLGEQQAIAEVLGALDDKIAVNARLRAISEALAHSEFRRLMAATTKTAPLGDLLTLEYGKSLPASRRKDGTVEVYGSGGIVGMHDAALLDGPGVVVGRKGTAGAVHWAPGPFCAIDTTFYAVPESGVPLIFCYYVLRALPLSEMNSDSAVPGLKRNEAHATITKRPDMFALARFADKAMTLFDQSRSANVENSVLAELRDALLPRLMSGKIRVKDAEKTFGEVL